MRNSLFYLKFALLLHLSSVGFSINPSTMSINPSTISINPSTMSINPSTISINPSTISINPSTMSINPSTMSINPSTMSINASTMSMNTSVNCKLSITKSAVEDILRYTYDHITQVVEIHVFIESENGTRIFPKFIWPWANEIGRTIISLKERPGGLLAATSSSSDFVTSPLHFITLNPGIKRVNVVVSELNYGCLPKGSNGSEFVFDFLLHQVSRSDDTHGYKMCRALIKEKEVDQRYNCCRVASGGNVTVCAEYSSIIPEYGGIYITVITSLMLYFGMPLIYYYLRSREKLSYYEITDSPMALSTIFYSVFVQGSENQVVSIYRRIAFWLIVGLVIYIGYTGFLAICLLVCVSVFPIYDFLGLNHNITDKGIHIAKKGKDGSDADERVKEGSDADKRVEEGSDAVKRMEEGSDAVKRMEEGSDAVKRVEEGSDADKRVEEGSDADKRVEEGSDADKRGIDTVKREEEGIDTRKILKNIFERYIMFLTLPFNIEFWWELAQSPQGESPQEDSPQGKCKNACAIFIRFLTVFILAILYLITCGIVCIFVALSGPFLVALACVRAKQMPPCSSFALLLTSIIIFFFFNAFLNLLLYWITGLYLNGTFYAPFVAPLVVFVIYSWKNWRSFVEVEYLALKIKLYEICKEFIEKEEREGRNAVNIEGTDVNVEQGNGNENTVNVKNGRVSKALYDSVREIILPYNVVLFYFLVRMFFVGNFCLIVFVMLLLAQKSNVDVPAQMISTMVVSALPLIFDALWAEHSSEQKHVNGKKLENDLEEIISKKKMKPDKIVAVEVQSTDELKMKKVLSLFLRYIFYDASRHSSGNGAGNDP